MIGVDWGSSNLRAYHFSDDGAVVDRRQSPRGITTFAAPPTPSAFEDVLVELIGDWAESAPVIVMCGMIGSRNGWREAPYLPCPADPKALAGALTPVPTRLGRSFIVPGLSMSAGGQPADVMRGEETKILGAGLSEGCVVSPGTHCKWAALSGGRIERFRTAMTGELYAVLLAHSLLGVLAAADAPHDEAAFARGAARGLENPALSMTLFSTRAEVLLGGLAAEAAAAYLSGLLIGSEVAAMRGEVNGPLALIGASHLSARYQTVLSMAGVEDVTILDADAAIARGLWTIGKALA